MAMSGQMPEPPPTSAAVGRPASITLGRAADLGTDRGVEAMRTRSHALLDAASAAGVRSVDAARSSGRAEDFLGAWLLARGSVPGAVTVGSTWGYRYTGAASWRMTLFSRSSGGSKKRVFRLV
jgi:aryl-alcohol dehydrogenase-like predicted oxidoreductase